MLNYRIGSEELSGSSILDSHAVQDGDMSVPQRERRLERRTRPTENYCTT